jgi:hypothetical protein
MENMSTVTYEGPFKKCAQTIPSVDGPSSFLLVNFVFLTISKDKQKNRRVACKVERCANFVLCLKVIKIGQYIKIFQTFT